MELYDIILYKWKYLHDNDLAVRLRLLPKTSWRRPRSCVLCWKCIASLNKLTTIAEPKHVLLEQKDLIIQIFNNQTQHLGILSYWYRTSIYLYSYPSDIYSYADRGNSCPRQRLPAENIIREIYSYCLTHPFFVEPSLIARIPAYQML